MWSTTIIIPNLFEDMTYKVNDSYIKKRGGALKIVYKVLKDRNVRRKYLKPLNNSEHDNTRPSTRQTKE